MKKVTYFTERNAIVKSIEAIKAGEDIVTEKHSGYDFDKKLDLLNEYMIKFRIPMLANNIMLSGYCAYTGNPLERRVIFSCDFFSFEEFLDYAETNSDYRKIYKVGIDINGNDKLSFKGLLL